VLGSSGSVVPKFKEQIEKGGPVTVTDPEVTRYFMLIPEAVELVLLAGAIGENGNIYVLDMGDPIRIADLARLMIELSGLRPRVDIEISYTGLRPGEKLFEELHLEGEESDTEIPGLMVLQSPVKPEHSFLMQVDLLLEECETMSHNDIRFALKRLVPEFKPYMVEEDIEELNFNLPEHEAEELPAVEKAC